MFFSGHVGAQEYLLSKFDRHDCEGRPEDPLRARLTILCHCKGTKRKKVISEILSAV
jgi:hypothetical protein